MNDYIDRQAAINVVKEYHERHSKYIGTPKDNDMYTYARGLIIAVAAGIERLSEPAAKPDIVYCHECIHGAPNGKYGCKAYHYKLYEVHEMGANDFCSKGERRTDG